MPPLRGFHIVNIKCYNSITPTGFKITSSSLRSCPEIYYQQCHSVLNTESLPTNRHSVLDTESIYALDADRDAIGIQHDKVSQTILLNYYTKYLFEIIIEII